MKLAVTKAIVVVLVVVLVETVTSQQPSTCENTFCPRGRMCIPQSGGGTVCQCPSSCSDAEDPVCSVYGIQFKNLCHLHMFACERVNINIAIKNQGPCDGVVDPGVSRCGSKYNLLQFPNRYLDWIVIARKQFLNPRFEVALGKRAEELNEDVVREFLEWEFQNVDPDGNGKIDDNEMKEIERELLSVNEGCISGFLKSCDLDGVDGISQREWFLCFPRGVRGEAIGSKL